MDERSCRIGIVAIALSAGALSVGCGGSNGDSQVNAGGSGTVTAGGGTVSIHVPDGTGGDMSSSGGAGSLPPGTLPPGFTPANMFGGLRWVTPSRVPAPAARTAAAGRPP